MRYDGVLEVSRCDVALIFPKRAATARDGRCGLPKTLLTGTYSELRRIADDISKILAAIDAERSAER